MRYLLAFLGRNRIFFLFLLLQAIAFSLTINSRSYQRAAFLNSSSKLTGNILETYSDYSLYLDLEEQNQRLLKENARLRSLVKESYLPTHSNVKNKTDSIYQVRYQYVDANVISSSYLKSRNYITLDKGRTHGIKNGMGVLCSNGAVGKIHNVSEHFSTVIPIINSDVSVISGAFLNDDQKFGPIKWQDLDYRKATLLDIPRQTKIVVGDTIGTYGESQIYPPGIPIGTVEKYELQADQNFYSVKIKLSTDFSSIRHVYIVKDMFRFELEQLEDQNVNQN